VWLCRSGLPVTFVRMYPGVDALEYPVATGLIDRAEYVLGTYADGISTLDGLLGLGGRLGGVVDGGVTRGNGEGHVVADTSPNSCGASSSLKFSSSVVGKVGGERVRRVGDAGGEDGMKFADRRFLVPKFLIWQEEQYGSRSCSFKECESNCLEHNVHLKQSL